MNTRKTIKETVEHAIYCDILNGVYPQNSIITERELIDKYHVSRTPIREALIELCQDNVLQSLPRLGYQVVPITLKEIMDIINFRVDLEEINLRHAFPKLTSEMLQELRKIDLMPPEDSMLLSTEWLENQAFHLALCSTSGNQYTYKLLQTVLRQSVVYIAKFCNSQLRFRAERQAGRHLEIINYLECKDLENAVIELRQDILIVKDEILQIYPEFNLASSK